MSGAGHPREDPDGHGLAWFEDIEIGLSGVTARRTVTEADITAFSGISGNFDPLHSDDVSATSSPYGRRIAQPGLVLAIADGLLSPGRRWRVAGYIEISRRLRAPVFAGDTVQVRWRVESLGASRSMVDAGLVRTVVTVVNQDEETVQDGMDQLLVSLRAPAVEPQGEQMEKPA
jgi:acyl dehydratase